MRREGKNSILEDKMGTKEILDTRRLQELKIGVDSN